MADNKKLNIPNHVGIIMDGNRRWAKKRLLPPSAGHSAGLKRMVALAEKAKEAGVHYMTVEKLFALIRKQFDDCVEKLLKAGAAVRVIGDLSLLPDDVRASIEDGVNKSPENAEFTFVMALGYGARSEIVRAVNTAVKSGKELTQDEFSDLLYTGGIPDPDLIIRTGGELRLSNFLLWQAAYAELYFTKVLFPDFSGREFEKALADYSARERSK